jgi:hypothetical protein
MPIDELVFMVALSVGFPGMCIVDACQDVPGAGHSARSRLTRLTGITMSEPRPCEAIVDNQPDYISI